MKSSISAITIAIGGLSLVAFLSGAAMYVWGFAGHSVSLAQTLWMTPTLAPVLFAIYLKSKSIGLALQAVVYSLAVFGAYRMFQNDCFLHPTNCYSHSLVVNVMGAMLSGYHMITAFAGLVLMVIETAKEFRRQPRNVMRLH